MNIKTIKKCLLILLTVALFSVLSLTAFQANAADEEQNLTTATESATEESEPTTEPTTDEPVTDVPEYGWTDNGGKWSYTDSNGTDYSDGMFVIEGKKYLFNAKGVVLTGMQKVNGKYYYFSTSGSSPENGLAAMASYTGWKKLNSSTYYFNSNSAVATGWKTISGSKYYFANNGKMATGWTKIGKKTFYFKPSGALGKKGAMLTGWKKIGKKTFYFAPKGAAGKQGVMATGFKKIGKNRFYFNEKGKNGNKGALQTGWKKVKKYTYYLKSTGKNGEKGKMLTSEIAGSKTRGYGYVDSNGRKVTTEAITLAVKFVKEHTTESQSNSEKLKVCFDYLWKNYPYQRIYGLPDAGTLSKDYAEYMLKNKKGNCFCYGAAYACIAKVLGYEARVGTGMIAAIGGGMTPHGWAEVKIGGTWYICDPDMQMNHPGINSYMRTRSNYPYRLSVNNNYTLTFSEAKAVWKKG